MPAGRTPGVLQRSDGLPAVVVRGGEAAQRYRNVLEALDRGVAAGADMFEFDVRCTADGVLVVHHDEAVGDQRLSVLTWHGAERAAREAGYTVPSLDEFLYRTAGTLALDVELKEAGCAPAVLQMLQRCGYHPDAFVVTSFEQAALDRVHEADSQVVTGLLVSDLTGAEALARFGQSGAAFLAADYRMADAAMLDATAAAGVPLVVWTVNETALMRTLLRAAPVVGLITDRPAEAMALRRRLGTSSS